MKEAVINRNKKAYEVIRQTCHLQMTFAHLKYPVELADNCFYLFVCLFCLFDFVVFALGLFGPCHFEVKMRLPIVVTLGFFS